MVRYSVRDCPFCGGEARVWTRTSFDPRVQKENTRTTVLCPECGCRTVAQAKPHDAIALWNQRVGSEKAARSSWLSRLFGR